MGGSAASAGPASAQDAADVAGCQGDDAAREQPLDHPLEVEVWRAEMLNCIPQADGVDVSLLQRQVEEVGTADVQPQVVAGVVARARGDVAARDCPILPRQVHEQAKGAAHLEQPGAPRHPGLELPDPAAKVRLVNRPIGQVIQVLRPWKYVSSQSSAASSLVTFQGKKTRPHETHETRLRYRVRIRSPPQAMQRTSL